MPFNNPLAYVMGGQEFLNQEMRDLSAQARGERFDVILADLMMPEMTGMDLHAALTALAPDQARRMVLLTGGAFTETASRFLDAVANARVPKALRHRQPAGRGPEPRGMTSGRGPAPL